MSTWQICMDSVSVTFPRPNSAVHSRTNDTFIVSEFAAEGRVGLLLHIIALSK